MRKRIRDWWITRFGGSCRLCVECYSGPVEQEDILMGPSMFLVPAIGFTCTRCGFMWEEY